MNALSTLTALLAACLAALIVYELRPQPASTLAPDFATDPALRTAGLAAPNTATTNRSTSLDTLLGRPLFSQTRRPGTEAGPTARTVVATPLPRMTAILIDGTRRSVIFAVPGPQQGNVRPVTVAEGGRVGAFTVESIAPQQVIVLGPEGRQTVRTSFDPTLPAPAPIPGPVAPLFPGIALPGSTPITTPGGRLPGGVIPQFNTQFNTPGGPPGAALGAAR